MKSPSTEEATRLASFHNFFVFPPTPSPGSEFWILAKFSFWGLSSVFWKTLQPHAALSASVATAELWFCCSSSWGLLLYANAHKDLSRSCVSFELGQSCHLCPCCCCQCLKELLLSRWEATWDYCFHANRKNFQAPRAGMVHHNSWEFENQLHYLPGWTVPLMHGGSGSTEFKKEGDWRNSTQSQDKAWPSSFCAWPKTSL